MPPARFSKRHNGSHTLVSQFGWRRICQIVFLGQRSQKKGRFVQFSERLDELNVQGDHDAASPCEHIDLPQTLMEPLLLRYATHHGFKCRMDTKFLSFEQDAHSVTTTVQDLVTGQIQKIKSRYLIGADGARSQIVKQLGLELDVKPGGGVALDVLVKADLSHLMKHRTGNLHWLMQPDVEYPDFGWMGVARMVKPWNEWIFSLFPSIQATNTRQPTNEEYLHRIKEFIGDDTTAELLMVSKWAINEIVAKEYAKGDV
jgi:2-polyprenyl-6-methoxyphenol hydroxylase-like FAD-dependent oxidoreductase